MKLGLQLFAIDESNESLSFDARGIEVREYPLPTFIGQKPGLLTLGKTGSVLHRFRSFGPLVDQSSLPYPEDAKPQSKEVDSLKPVEFTEAQLCSFTNNFDERNLIGPTQFGKVYRAKIERGLIGAEALDVIVKIWDEKAHRLIRYYNDYNMVDEEVMFLTDPSIIHHPNLVKLIGYCRGEQVRGVVYDLNPLDTLHNMATKGCFPWIQRIKVAPRFARLLKFLHYQAKPYVVLNIDAEHIMLDQDWNPVLYDFGLLSGGILGELTSTKKATPMSLGYVDPFLAATGLGWNANCDVFSFGVVLLGLIAKQIIDKKTLATEHCVLIDVWARKEYKPKCSLVHSSLVEDSRYRVSDGQKITVLAMLCAEKCPNYRPTMKEVVECLEGLSVVQHYSDEIGM